MSRRDAPGLARSARYLVRNLTTRLMAAGVLLGLAAPPLAALLAPLLVPTLLIPLTLALLRLDWRAVFAYRSRARLIVALVAWLLLVSPVLVYALTVPLAAAGFPEPLRQAVVLMAASSPIVSSVALALILDLDAALAVVGVLTATALVPLTLPAMAALLLGLSLDVPLGTFMLRLVLLVGAAFGAAWLVRRVVSAQTLQRAAPLLDLLTVIALVVFAIAIMDGVTAFALRRPGYVAVALLAAFGFNLLLQAAGYGLFRHLGERAALAVAFMSGNCNMGLVLVALQGQAPEELTVFFALAQIPMYVLPALLGRVYAARLAAAERVRKPV
jgi:BASS family bile acid:Na+ symporter